MNVQLILIHAALLTFLFPAGITEKPPADTLKIKTEGTGNYIQIDSAWFSGSLADTVITAGATGEIKQTGENNQVEINTAGPKKCAEGNNKVTIKQTGKNNSVKIKQH